MLMMSSSLLSISALSCMVALVSQRRHFLMGLLALEGMVLNITLLVMVLYPHEVYSAFIVITMGACEASLGLATLVAMTRTFGNDLFSSLNLSKC